MDNPIDEDITTDVDDIRKILDIMEGEKIRIDWDKDINIESGKIYDLTIGSKSFLLEQKNLFFLLKFYGFKSFYRNSNGFAEGQIPKLYYKDKELGKLLKDRHMHFAIWPQKENRIEKEEGEEGTDFWRDINRIMRKRYENMETLYFAHPMITYNTDIEKECLNIIEREIGNKLPSSIKEVINPNSDKYKWKGEYDMHGTEDWGFSWKKFADSMPYYCNLVYNSDGLIYLPIFDLNRRKNARVKFTRKIKRGVKTEISYCTKLGDPLITFTDPDNDMLPANIWLPGYMIDYVRGRVTGPTYSTNNEKIINITDNIEIGMIEGNIIKDVNNVVIAKIVRFAYVNCDKCNVSMSIPISEVNDESELTEFCNSPHKNCGGKISFHISEYDRIVDMKDNVVGHVGIQTDFTTCPCSHIKYISYGTFKGNLYNRDNYNKNEASGRYNSPYPFHMYINKKTDEIHEKPDDAGSLGGDVVPFEPWTKLSS